MKKIWSAPVAIAEQFAANEYVAACYLVSCDVPSGMALYAESNGVEGLQMSGSNADTKLIENSGIHGCQKMHGGVIRDTNPEKNGYWVTGYDYWDNEYEYVEVFWWEENLGSDYDYHASESLRFETNPNAS